MPDISMCYGKDCPLRSKCYRYLAHPDPIRQAYLSAAPLKDDDGNVSCDYFWEWPPDESQDEWVPFGDVARDILGMQSQYASRYIDWYGLGEGLRFQASNGGPVDVSDYHFIDIHRGDVSEFVRRVRAHKNEKTGV